MNKIISLIIILLLAFEVVGQKINVNANIGYGTYFQNDLKKIQMDLISSTSVNDKPVEKFPNNIYYSFTTDFAFNKNHLIGLGLSYYTSGARNHIADYSGEYKLDMIINAYALSVNYKVRTKTIHDINIYFQIKLGVLYSFLNISEDLEIYNTTSFNSRSEYKGNSFIFEPGIFLNYPIYKSVSLNFNLGFEGSLNSRLFNVNGNDQDLIDYGNNIRMNWSGIRTSIGITVTLQKKDKLR